MELRALGIAAALGSAASWAVGSILFKQIGEKLSPLAMTLAKGGVSVLLLGVVLSFTGYAHIDWQALLLLTLSGLLGIALGDTFFFEALQDIGAHVLVSLMMLGQVFTILLAVVFLGEMPSPTAWGGIFLAIVGIGLIVSAQLSSEKQSSSWRGIVFGLLSVFCMSVSIIIAKFALESTSAIQATFVRMFSGTLGMFCFGAFTRRLGNWVAPFQELKLVYLFLVSVCVITFGGFWLSLVAVKYVDVSIAYTLSSTEPLFVLPLAIIFLKEKVAFKTFLGAAISMAGIALLCAS